MFFNKKKYNVLIIGKDSMLGHDLVKFLEKKSIEKNSCINVVHAIGHEDIDITKSYAISTYLNTNVLCPPIKFDYVINCAAYTNTTAAELDRRSSDASYRLNAIAPKLIAESCAYHKAKFIHISTDYVFSQEATAFGSSVWSLFGGFCNNHTEFPVNNYGMHKLVGELYIKNVMNEKDYAILRTSWLYGSHKHKSFVHKFLKNAVESVNREDRDIYVTDLEDSVPTSTSELSHMIYNVIKFNLHGICNATGCAAKSVSRYEWASLILSEAKKYTSFFDNLTVSTIEGADKKEIDAARFPKLGKMRYPVNSKMSYVTFRKLKDDEKFHDGMSDGFANEFKNWMLENHKDLFEFIGVKEDIFESNSLKIANSSTN